MDLQKPPTGKYRRRERGLPQISLLEPRFKERPVQRLPFPVLRCYWPKLAEQQEEKWVKDKEMYFDVLVFDSEPDLDNLWLEDDEPIKGIVLRQLR